MRLWAFGTSPHGLGLKASDLWRLSHREFDALANVYRQTIFRWAVERAQELNLHSDTKGVPWTADDILGKTNRDARRYEHDKGKLMAALANTSLAKIKKGAPAGDEIPEWAKGPYRGGAS